MSLRDYIVEQIIRPEMNDKKSNVRGTVLYYDKKKNLATVGIPQGEEGSTFLLTEVPVQLGSGGVHSAGPFIGDVVWVAYINGDPKCPTIISLVDETYDKKTRAVRTRHMRKGALVPHAMSAHEDW